MSTTKGRCTCGAIEFEFSGDPLWVAYCHCESCRRQTSSPVTAYIGAKVEQFDYLKGEAVGYQSSPDVWRYFCGTCGAPLAHTADKRTPGEVHVMLGALEDPTKFKPTAHVNVAEQLAWFEIHDDLPRFEKLPQDGEPVRKGPRP